MESKIILPLIYGVFIALCSGLAVYSYWRGYRDGKNAGQQKAYLEGYGKGYSEAVDNVKAQYRLREPGQTWPPAWGGQQ